MDSSPPRYIYIPDQWSQAAESISCSSTPPIVFICGAKNCGKTTFSRYLLNIVLQKYTKVAYLDTDVGQPEFTPPAFLSLTIVHKVTPGWFVNPCLNFFKIVFYNSYQNYSFLFLIILDFTVPCLKTPERYGTISSQ